MSTHAQLSPSSAIRWMRCPGSVALCAGLPDTSSSYADEGTDAHELAAQCLITETPASLQIGTTMALGNVVSQDMAENVQKYVDYVRDLRDATGGVLMVEQRLPIGHLTGEDDAHGTADAVILAPGELIVVDLKFGRGVEVSAEDNPQLQIYALAAMAEFGLVHDFTQVRMVIHQPRLGNVSEWTQTVEELDQFAEQVAEAAEFTRRDQAPLMPSEKGCKFCKAAGTCPALANEVMDQFDAVPEAASASDEALGVAMTHTNLIESWIKAVRAEVEARLLAGKPVPGFKIVQGKRGNRAWTDADDVERMFKDTFRLKTEQMYDLKLISPTSAEKLQRAGDIGPRQWAKVLELIHQPDGKPSVAPESDKRPALVMSAAASDFEDVTNLA